MLINKSSDRSFFPYCISWKSHGPRTSRTKDHILYSVFSLSCYQKWKCKPVNTESPESGKWKKINIQAKNQVYGITHMWDVHKNVLLKFVRLCMETPCWCPFEGHKYGRRKLTKTSDLEFSYLCMNLSVEEFINMTSHSITFLTVFHVQMDSSSYTVH